MALLAGAGWVSVLLAAAIGLYYRKRALSAERDLGTIVQLKDAEIAMRDEYIDDIVKVRDARFKREREMEEMRAKSLGDDGRAATDFLRSAFD